jgi:AraC family transcriptional regulator
MQTPIERALWFIESHFAGSISLDDIAAVSGLSRFQMSREFSRAMGMPVTAYIRSRRLTEAARKLASGAGDILAVAVEAGYGSHEAFTRAFHGQFGVTPAELRERRNLDGLALVEPARKDPELHFDLAPPRIESVGALAIAGIGARFTGDDKAGIPALWQRLHPYLGHVPGQRGRTAYGLMTNLFAGSGGYYYLAGIEVADLSDIPREFTGIRLPPQPYAKFTHRGHITTIVSAAKAIWRDWLPGSGHTLGDMPDFLECYGEDFDPWTGSGGFEMWLPLKA